MTTPSSLPHAERLFSGRIGAEYDMLRLICPAAADMSRRVGEVVAGISSVPTGRPCAVEIGCGTGVTTLALLHACPGLDITAIDNEPAMLDQARANLREFAAAGRLRLVETDALAAMQDLPSASVDIVASAYTIHNFLDGYRTRVLGEIYRVLRPSGIFVNGDRYALDDTLEQTRLTQAEAHQYFAVLGAMGRTDLLEQWILHLFSDESVDRLMRLGPALRRLREIGFDFVEVRFRDGINTLVTAVKSRA